MDAGQGARAAHGMTARDVPDADLELTARIVRIMRRSGGGDRSADVAARCLAEEPRASEEDVRRCLMHAARLYCDGVRPNAP